MITNYFRILVAGTVGSGKTRFIDEISEIKLITGEDFPVPSDAVVTSPRPKPFDFGRISSGDDHVLYFFSASNGLRAFSIFKSVFITDSERTAIVMILDAQRPETFPEARAILAEVRQTQPTYIVAANYRFPLEPHPTLFELREALLLQAEELILPFYGRALDSSIITLELLVRLPQTEAVQALIQRIESLHRL